MNVSAVQQTSSTMVGSSAPISAPHPVIGSSQTEEASGGGTSVNQEELKQIVEQMQSQLDSMNISLHYTLYGEHLSKVAVKVVDKATGDVIREIPPKEMQALQAKMSELVGMIFNRKA
jgi:flagellar protein FlaG